MVERPKWSLIAVSEAARKWRNRFVLEPNKSYAVGRRKHNDIQLPTPLCSAQHCWLESNEDEIIMKDNVSFTLEFLFSKKKILQKISH